MTNEVTQKTTSNEQNVSSSNGLEGKVPELRFSSYDDSWTAEKLSDFTVRVTRKNSKNQTDLPLTISSKDGLTSWLEYFVAGVADAFGKVNEHAKDEKTKGFTSDKSPLLRELDIKQRKVLELFAEFKEANSLQIAEILSISPQSARFLLRQWIAEGFLQYANESKKARTYKLTEKFERLI